MIAVREALIEETPAAAPVAVLANLVSRAQGLVRAPVREPTGLGVWLRGTIGFAPDSEMRHADSPGRSKRQSLNRATVDSSNTGAK